jgi:hypothetical protein
MTILQLPNSHRMLPSESSLRNGPPIKSVEVPMADWFLQNRRDGCAGGRSKRRVRQFRQAPDRLPQQGDHCRRGAARGRVRGFDPQGHGPGARRRPDRNAALPRTHPAAVPGPHGQMRGATDIAAAMKAVTSALPAMQSRRAMPPQSRRRSTPLVMPPEVPLARTWSGHPRPGYRDGWRSRRRGWPGQTRPRGSKQGTVAVAFG